MMIKTGSSSAGHRSIESTLALQRLFGWIESRFGGLPFDTGTSAAEIITSQGRIQGDDLHRLLTHQATGLHVQGFYPPAAARELGRQLARDFDLGKGRNWKVSTSRGLESSDVVTLGAHDPFNVASASGHPAEQDLYFKGVIRELDQRRIKKTKEEDKNYDSVDAEPQLWPLDLLRLQLDEAWPAGAGLAREPKGRKRPFGGGLARVMKGPSRWKNGFIHVDEMGPLNPNQGLFSANIYLQLPDQAPAQENSTNVTDDNDKENGQDMIHIWPVGIRNRWDWYRNALLLSGLSSQDVEAQLRLWKALGQPQTVRAAPGDLVLLCVQRPHAPVGFQSGTRVSLQCFIQHTGRDHRLLIDS